MTSPTTTPPGPGFVVGVAAATGIHHTSEYALAQLLLTHPGPRRAAETTEAVEDGMRSLAHALCLGPGDQPPPAIGARLMTQRGRVALDYGHEQYVMTIPPPSQDWLALVERGAPCRICLVFVDGPDGDVKITSCKVDATTSWPSAELLITNRSSKTSNYMVSVEFVDASGKRLGDAFTAINNLAPGQKAEETAQGLDTINVKIKCRVTEVTRYAS